MIRVFGIPQGQKLFQFRRGSYPAHIYSISFSLDSNLLAVSGDTDTIHVYKLEEKEPQSASSSALEPPKRSVIDTLYSHLN